MAGLWFRALRKLPNGGYEVVISMRVRKSVCYQMHSLKREVYD